MKAREILATIPNIEPFQCCLIAVQGLERPVCERSLPFAGAANAHAEIPCIGGKLFAAMQPVSPKRSLDNDAGG